MYNTRYFIEKFEAIPEERWIANAYSDEAGNHCAFGHCGVRHGEIVVEASALQTLFDNIKLGVAYVNDVNDGRYPQPTPKQRILAALRDIEKLESDELINNALIGKEGEKELITS